MRYGAIGRRQLWLGIVVASFSLIYTYSLTFAYSDIDDATSIEYHVLGRDDSVQPPFERFQMGMDVILGLLPANEMIIRVSAICASALGAVAFVIAILFLAFDMTGLREWRPMCLVTMVILLSSPEYFYLGLVYTPMLVGLALAVFGHVMLRKRLRAKSHSANWNAYKDPVFWVSVFVTGVGCIFRWDILAYACVAGLEMTLLPLDKESSVVTSFRRRFRILLVWVTLVIGVWLGLCVARGDFLLAIQEIGVAANETSEDSTFADIRVVASHALLFSPAFLLPAIL